MSEQIRAVIRAAALVAGLLATSDGGAQEAAERRAEAAELPEFELPLMDSDELENPLFEPLEIERMPRIDDQGRPLDSAPAETPEVAPPPPDDVDIELSDEERELYRVARAAAPAVLSLRAYDRFGIELTRAAGFFVSDSGHVVSDVSLVAPEVEADISYITAIAGDRTTFRIRGVWRRDLESGVLVLQADAANTPYLEFAQSLNADPYAKVFLVGFDDERGLLLADARARFEQTAVGDGWLEVTGEDSQGDVGSPLLDANSRVVGLVAMGVPLDNWVNYAIPVGGMPLDGFRSPGELVPVDRLDSLASRDVLESSRFLKAYQRLYDGDERQALRLLTRLSRQYPRSPEVWALLALALRKAGAPEEALSAQRKAVALDPGAGSQWRQLVQAEMAAGAEAGDGQRKSDMKSALERAVTQRPGDRIAWMLLAQEHLRDGEWRQADRALRQVVKIEPDYARGLYLLAVVRGKLGDYDNARAVVERSLRYNRRNAGAWFYLGLLRERAGELRAAVEAYERCVRADPGHPNAWANLASAYKRTGNAAKARQAIQQHIAAPDER